MCEERGLLPSTALPAQKIKLANHIAVIVPACNVYTPWHLHKKNDLLAKHPCWSMGWMRDGRGQGGILLNKADWGSCCLWRCERAAEDAELQAIT